MSCGLTKQLNCWAMINRIFGGKRWKLWSLRTPSQLWSMGVTASCCGAVLLQEGLMFRWHHEKRKLCGYIEAASEGISQEVEVEAWAQMALPNEQWPKHSSKLFTKWLKYNKVKVLEWSQSQRPDLNLIENMWVALKGEWEQEGLQAWPRYTSSVKRTGPWCPSTTVESWWKDTWNIWPKWNSVGAILPNTKEAYVCFWL